MNVITTAGFIAGIFAEWNDAQDYIARKPETIKGFHHTNSSLVYPFYLLELDDGCFIGFQTEEEARDQNIGIILYTIEQDYMPHVPWNDEIGSLEHEHL